MRRVAARGRVNKRSEATSREDDRPRENLFGEANGTAFPIKKGSVESERGAARRQEGRNETPSVVRRGGGVGGGGRKRGKGRETGEFRCERFLFERRQRLARVGVKVAVKRFICAKRRDVEAEGRVEEEAQGRSRGGDEETRVAGGGEKEDLRRERRRVGERTREFVGRRETATFEENVRRRGRQPTRRIGETRSERGEKRRVGVRGFRGRRFETGENRRESGSVGESNVRRESVRSDVGVNKGE